MFSIIIPIHNAEKTINKCLDSLLSQTYSDFEAILIENGSSDRSFEICKKYSLKDKRFRTFSIGECNGPSRPRNVGLKEAKGDYIAFLDADDWFGFRVLEMLIESFTSSNADIVFYGFSMNADDKAKKHSVFPKVTASITKNICIQLYEQDCFGYTSCKAFRRCVLSDTFFDEKLSLFEDELFVLSVLKHTENIYVVPEKFNYTDYYYLSKESDNSLMYRTHPDIIQLKDKEYRAWKDYLGVDFQIKINEIANNAVNYCRFYVFEHQLPIKESYYDIVNSYFYKDAIQKPRKRTKQISKGYLRFRLDWLIWKIKTTLK